MPRFGPQAEVHRRMSELKLIFAGPVGAGKTTAINVLSDKPSLNTDKAVSDVTAARKTTTTVAMDYGCLTLNDTQKIHLYGTPGQTRFRFMWELLANELAADCAGLVLLIDNTRASPFRDLKYYAQEFSNLITRKKLIIGVTRSDMRAEPELAQYESWVEELGLTAEVVFLDARSKSNVLALLQRFIGDHVDADWPQLLADAENAPHRTLPTVEQTPSQVSDYLGENIIMKDSIVDDVLNIKGVEGAALATSMGDIVTSSLDDTELDDFIGFMVGIVPVFEQVADLGKVQSVVLKSDNSENLSVYVEEEQVLGVVSSNRTSVRILRQQLDDLLQWG